MAEVEGVLADEAAALARIAAAEADEVLVVEPEEEPADEAPVESAPPKVQGVRPLSPVAAITIEVPATSEEDAVEEVKVVSAPPADAAAVVAAADTAAGTESAAPMELGSDLYVGADDDFEEDFEEDLELPERVQCSVDALRRSPFQRRGSLYYIPGVATERADGRLVPPFHQTLPDLPVGVGVGVR